jgi:hypothetical protein
VAWQGYDWAEIARLVKEQRKHGNPVAAIIHRVRLETNSITLLLSNSLDNADEDELTKPVRAVCACVRAIACESACICACVRVCVRACARARARA